MKFYTFSEGTFVVFQEGVFTDAEREQYFANEDIITVGMVDDSKQLYACSFKNCRIDSKVMEPLIHIVELKDSGVCIAGWADELLDCKFIGDKTLIRFEYELTCKAWAHDSLLGEGCASIVKYK